MFESSRVRAVVFDLDGTLVETEHLKAESYAELIGMLRGAGAPEPAAIALYRSIVGATDLAVCEAMIERFEIEPLIAREPGETAVRALHRQRMSLYRRSYGTPENLASLIYPQNVDLLKRTHSEGLATGVATMSFAEEANRVLGAIGVLRLVGVVVGVDDVANPKPAPDAFIAVMERLGIPPDETLIIEDSPRGAHAAAASGAKWLCVATEFSEQALRADEELDPDWIVWRAGDLESAVKRRIEISD